jgi:hypothetical protein
LFNSQKDAYSFVEYPTLDANYEPDFTTLTETKPELYNVYIVSEADAQTITIPYTATDGTEFRYYKVVGGETTATEVTGTIASNTISIDLNSGDKICLLYVGENKINLDLSLRDNSFSGVDNCVNQYIPQEYSTTLPFTFPIEFTADGVDVYGCPIIDWSDVNSEPPCAIITFPEIESYDIFDRTNTLIWSSDNLAYDGFGEELYPRRWKVSTLLRGNEFLSSLTIGAWKVFVRESGGGLKQIVAYSLSTSREVQGGRCYKSTTGTETISYGIGLANAEITYLDETGTEQTITANSSGVITLTIGYHGIAWIKDGDNYTHLWLRDEGAGTTSYDCVGDANGTIANANLDTFHAKDIRFESYQDKYGYSIAALSNGTDDYVQPEVSQNANQRIECEFVALNTDVVAAQGSNGTWWGWKNTNFVYNQNSNAVNFGLVDNDKHKLIIDNKNNLLYFDDNTPLVIPSINNTQNIEIFRILAGFEQEMILFNWRYYLDDVLIRNLVPQENGTLLDTVNNASYSSQGAGDLETLLIPLRYSSDGTPTSLDIFGNTPTYLGEVIDFRTKILKAVKDTESDAIDYEFFIDKDSAMLGSGVVAEIGDLVDTVHSISSDVVLSQTDEVKQPYRYADGSLLFDGVDDFIYCNLSTEFMQKIKTADIIEISISMKYLSGNDGKHHSFVSIGNIAGGGNYGVSLMKQPEDNWFYFEVYGSIGERQYKRFASVDFYNAITNGSDVKILCNRNTLKAVVSIGETVYLNADLLDWGDLVPFQSKMIIGAVKDNSDFATNYILKNLKIKLS